MASLHHLLLPLLLSSLSLLTVHAAITSQESNCTNDFYVLEKELLSRSRNRYNLTKAFFPSRDANPVVIRVTYIFEGPNSTNETWFWTESLFYVIQPLEIFQFTSLFFSDLPYRKQEVTVTLGADCIDTEKEYLMILTQRLKLYSQSATTSPTSASQRLNQDYFAVAVSLEEVEHDDVINTFVKVWLHITLALFPLSTWLVLYLCDPVHLLLGEQTWQKLEDEHTHGNIAALIQISVMFTTYVFIIDWIAFGATISNDLLSYDTHPTFYLTTLTGMIIDIAAFVWVVYVLIRSCHCNVYYFWKNWNNPESEQLIKRSERIKKLMSTIMVAPVLCFANHLYYIILAFISDPFHAGSTLILYGISIVLHYFIFKQFYNRVVLHVHHRGSPQEKEQLAVDILAGGGSRIELPEPESPSTPRRYSRHMKPPKIRRKILRVPFNTQVVVYGLFLIGPVLALYEAVIIILFTTLPITKLTEDAPSRLYGLYQGTGILIVALLSYNIVLRPSPFSITKAVEKMAKELRVSSHYPKWYKFSDEEKVANMCVYLLRHNPGPSPSHSEHDIRTLMKQQSTVSASNVMSSPEEGNGDVDNKLPEDIDIDHKLPEDIDIDHKLPAEETPV